MRTIRSCMAPAVALLASAPLHARDWTHEIAPYLWGTGLEGTIAVGPLSADIDASFGDILDAVYAGLGGDGRGPGNAVKADWVDPVIGLYQVRHVHAGSGPGCGFHVLTAA